MTMLRKEIKSVIKSDDDFRKEILDCIDIDYYLVLNKIKKNIRNKLINHFKNFPNEACRIKPYDSCLCVKAPNVKIAKGDISTDSWQRLKRVETVSIDKDFISSANFIYFQVDCHVRHGLFKYVLSDICVQADFSMFGEIISWLRQEGLRIYIETKNKYFYDDLFICPPEEDD